MDSIIADDRIAEGDNVAGTGRVGQYFLIPGHSGIKYDLSLRFSLCSNPLPLKNITCFQNDIAFRHLPASSNNISSNCPMKNANSSNVVVSGGKILTTFGP